MFEMNACEETVSIIVALFFGADGACVDIGPTSILGGVGLFIACVMVLRIVAMVALRRNLLTGSRKNSRPEAEVDEPIEKQLKHQPYESPIRTTNAWGRKSR